MSILLRSLPFIVLVQLGGVLNAQEAEAPSSEEPAVEAPADEAPADEGPAPDETAGEPQTGDDTAAGELDLGQAVDDDPSYIKEQYGDWQLQCFRTETGDDPCQMYQLLREAAGNPVAEFTVFRLPGTDQAVAGATIVAPLGTLLPQGIRISVDDGPQKVYSFSFCSMVGCFARIGFTEEDIEAFKAGGGATLTIVPAQAPDQIVQISASLDGFTAAFNEVSVLEN